MPFYTFISVAVSGDKQDRVAADEIPLDEDVIERDDGNPCDKPLNEDEHHITFTSTETQTETPTRAPSPTFQDATPEIGETTFVATTASQTDGVYVTQNSIYEIQAQLASLVGQFAIVQTEMKQMKDLMARRQVSTPSSPSTPVTPQTPRSEGNHVPLYGKMEDGVVKLEVHNGSVRVINVPKKDYDRIFYNARTATSFLRQLLPIAFSKAELAVSNFEGGKVISSQGYVVKEALERPRLTAVMRTVELEFPGSTVGKENMARLRDAVNDRCRFASRQMQF